jgi:hypothetical protein
MKNLVIILVLAVAALAPHLSQAADATKGIPGFYDPTTATFMPLVVPKAVPLAKVNRTGTVKISITLNIEAAIGTDEPISCDATISTFDSSFTNSASASATVVRSSLTSGSLTLSIPYDWTLANATETASVGTNCSESGGFSAGSVGHSIAFTVPGFTVPTKPGTVTTINLTGSL